MKKFLSVFLSLLTVLTVFAAFSFESALAETVITNVNPVITCDAGEKIALSGYTVIFDGDTAATKVDKWQLDGKTVTEFTPSAKGVTKLTAVAGGKQKTIYVVAKNKTDDEYVLYETDFSEFSTLQDMKNAGWKFLNADSYYSISGGILKIGSQSHDYIRAILPEWLGDFGQYAITTDIKMTEAKDSGRWFGVVYRIQNANGNYYPYYHMCIRCNTTSNNGIEFAERTTSNSWNVATTTAGEVGDMKNGFHTVKVEAFDTVVKYSMDDTQLLYVTNSVIGASTKVYTKGQLGITMNYGVTAVDNIKVCVQKTTPERYSAPTNLTNNEHQQISFRNPIAIVDTVASASEVEKSMGNAYIEVNGKDMNDFLKKCVDENVLPNFYCKTNADVDKVISATLKTSTKDLSVISPSASVLAYAKSKKPQARTGLEINLTKDTLSSEEANEYRLAIRKAPATFCVISSEHATHQVVAELQELAVAVWVKVEADKGEDFIVESAKALNCGANGVICYDAKALADVMNTYYASTAMTRVPMVIGHRGNPTQAMENSMSSYKKAYENGADVFEIDVYITKDKEIVIMHDNTITRTTNYTGSTTIANMTLAEIQSYYLLNLNGTVSTEKVPTVRELCEYFFDKDIRIFVEFKSGTNETIKKTLDIFKEFNMEDRIDVISFGTDALTYTQQQIPGMSTGYLCSGGSVASVEDAINTFYSYWTTANSVKSSVNPNATNFSFIQVGTDRGVTIWPWTFTSSTNNNAFLSGCDGITTNDCQWFKNMYKYVVASKDSENLEIGDTSKTTVKGEIFQRQIKDVAPSRVVVLKGGEHITVSGASVKGKSAGEAVVMYEYKTKTYGGTEYTLYTQPVTINVVDSSEKTGDIDGNGKVESKDYLLLKRYCLRTLELTDNQLRRGDIDKNNKVDAKDYGLLKRACLGTYTIAD